MYQGATKRQAQLEKSLEKAREAKKRRAEGDGGADTAESATIETSGETGEPIDLLYMSDDTLDTEDGPYLRLR